MSDVKELLRRVPFFRDFSEADLTHLSGLVIRKTFPRDNLIVLAEDEGDTLFIIVRGQVKVSLISEDGREVILAMLGSGDFFGEMSLLDGKPRSATVTAAEETELVTLRRSDFIALLKRMPDLAIAILAALTTRLRKADRKIESLALMDVSGRIAAALLQMAEEVGQHRDDDIVIHNRPTHQALANMAGTTRETVTRVLKRLEQEGYLYTTGRDLVIMREHDLRSEQMP
jgi:CRP/FNR family transcriptional regulator, cyclic AMP receptor protein